MLRQVRHGQEHSKRGYTLLELIVAVIIIVTVLAMVMGGYKTSINKAKLEKTVNEMMSLAQASLDFYNTQGNWPMTTGDLSPTYMYAGLVSSPFGGKYQISDLYNAVTVSTMVPSGLAENYYQGTLLQILPGNGQDTVEITQQLPNEFSGRLEYANKYLYKQ